MGLPETMAQGTSDNNGWGKYQLLVLSELKSLKESHAEILESLAEVKLDVNTLKVKSALWGSVAGAGVAGVISVIVGLLLKVLRMQ